MLMGHSSCTKRANVAINNQDHTIYLTQNVLYELPITNFISKVSCESQFFTPVKFGIVVF